MSEEIKTASIIILSYNSREDLTESIPSLRNQTYRSFEIIVVDNASTDESDKFVKDNYPEIKVIQNGKNIGYAAGNNAGFKVAKGEYIVVVNPDIIADPNWLAELIKPLEEDSSITATTSKILIYHQKDKINTCANINHYTGLTFCRGLNKSIKDFEDREIVAAVSGCSFAIRRDMLIHLDGFDSDFFLYEEDADLSWRIRFAGGKIVFVPTSIIYHKYEVSITPWKEFYLERNRYLILLKSLNSKTLIFFSPTLAATEIVTIGHAFLNGPKHIKNKLNAYWWIVKNYKTIKIKRKETLSKKVISDREFFESLEWRIPFEQVISSKIICQAAEITYNSFYRLYFNFAKKMI